MDRALGSITRIDLRAVTSWSTDEKDFENLVLEDPEAET